VDIYHDYNPLYLCFSSLEVTTIGTLRFLVLYKQGCSMSVSVAPTLCDRCSPMFQGSFLSMKGSWRNHHDSIQSLQQAADKNCFICRDVWKALIRLNLDRETLHAKVASKDYLTECFMDKDRVYVDCCVHSFLTYLEFRYVKTQRESALQPSRVRTPSTNVKQWNIKPHSIPHPSGLGPPRT
jgi:hypothetical protein